MGISHETATDFFNRGEFLALVRACPQIQEDRRRLESRLRVILAHALALTGDLDSARDLATPDAANASCEIRSEAETALGLVMWRRGEINSALKHFRAALRLAQESLSVSRIAWAHLRLFRILIDREPVDVLGALARTVRQSVLRAGNPQATAYLHLCVAVLAGQTGHLDEAKRHCDVTASLLQAHPNWWILGGLSLNRATIAALSGQAEEGLLHLEGMKRALAKSGHSMGTACDSTLGYLQLVTGQLDKAERTLVRTTDDRRTSSSPRILICVLDNLARVYLAQGELDKCERTLDRIDDEWQKDVVSYDVRYASLTRARLLIRRGNFRESIAWLTSLAARTESVGDPPFSSLNNLLLAQAYSLIGDHAEASARLLNVLNAGIGESRQLQAEYYSTASTIIGKSSPIVALQARQRGHRLRHYSGAITPTLQPEDCASARLGIQEPPDTQSIHGATVDALVDALAALPGLAYNPRLIGDELVAILRMLGCSPEVRTIRARSSDIRASDKTATLVLGADGGRISTLSCDVPPDEARTALVGNVLRIARAAIELERFRDDELNRAAIWPAAAIEEQAGALFLTEEMHALIDIARRIGPTTVPVLITGETGTGKEVLARVIHAYSNRASVTFLPFNCSGVPKDMLDSQLFGHRRGAFTGAIDSFPGVIRSAAGGTLFLDEIGETTLDVQPKLLRFLESSEVHPIGETQPLKVDVRVIAATNADLDALVAQGRFREDLFYRLNIVRLHVPPLRERRVEIPALASHYLQKHAQEYRKGELRLAEETMEYLVLYRWPGNVRQLANEMRRMAALAEAGAVLMPEHLSPEIAASRRTIPASDRALDPTELVVRVDQPVAAAIQHLERVMIQYALNTCGGRMEDTAAMLGLSRKGLYLKRLRYGLETPESAAAEVA